MIRKTKRILTSAALLAAVVTAGATSTVTYTCNQTGATPTYIGFQTRETYDVAIKIPGGAAAGARVTALSVPVPMTMESLSAASGWITTTLALNDAGTINVPDICSVDATVEGGMLSVVFPEPYAIPAEGVYVGYTLSLAKINESTALPIAVVDGTNSEGLFLHARRSLMQWTDYSSESHKVSAMTVTLEGNFASDAAALRQQKAIVYAAAGSDAYIPIDIVNTGLSPVSAVSYTYSIEGTSASGSGTLVPDEGEIPAIFGASATGRIPLTAPSAEGRYTVTITTDGVNGKEAIPSTVSVTLSAVPFVALSRPLVEEYTGMWCTECPAGIGIMEMMRELHPDKFVSIVYHDKDYLASPSPAPMQAVSWPSCTSNRNRSFQPMYLPAQWAEDTEATVPAEVAVDIEWADAARTELKATVRARFMEDASGSDYRLGAALVADGLSNYAWVQRNSLMGQTNKYPGKWFEPFTTGTENVRNVVYNDVFLAWQHIRGEEGSLPASITAGEWASAEYTFSATGYVSVKGNTIPVDLDRLRVVGVIFDSSGTPVSAASSAASGGIDSIESIIAPASNDDSPVYDLLGRRAPEPLRPGIYIRSGHIFKIR